MPVRASPVECSAPRVPVPQIWDPEVAAFGPPERAPDRRSGPPTVSMACLGRHGRWGNTILQYFFLQAFAREFELRVETPAWIGQALFRCDDDALSRMHPNVLLDDVSAVHDSSNYFWMSLDVTCCRAVTIKNDTGRRVFALRGEANGVPPELPFDQADLEGLFMVHTGYLAPHRDYIQSRVRLRPEHEEALQAPLRKLHAMGKTVVGIHARMGDFKHPAMMQGFEFVPPFSMYLDWLRDLWPTLENPVLFIASDEPDSVLPHFADYAPVTSASLDAVIPEVQVSLPYRCQDKEAGFLPDWYLLTQCDCLAISNSSFAFSASMLNERGTSFVRPPIEGEHLIPYDPWDSEPILHLPPQRWVVRDFAHRLALHTRTFGRTDMPRTIARLAKAYVWFLRHRWKVCRFYYGRGGAVRKMLNPAFFLRSRYVYD